MTEADDEFVMMGEDFQRDAKDAKTRRRGWGWSFEKWRRRRKKEEEAKSILHFKKKKKNG